MGAPGGAAAADGLPRGGDGVVGPGSPGAIADGQPRNARCVLPDSRWLWFPIDLAQVGVVDEHGRARTLNAAPDAPMRLIVFPQAGAGAAVWERWLEPGALSDRIEVCVIELPGRGSRPTDRSFIRMTKAAAAFLDECSALLCDKPYCVLGHSLGAWLAYEVCAQAQARGLPLPRKLYASANRAPHLHHLKHDVDPTPFSRLPKERFWKAWGRRYGHIPGLESEHVRDQVYPMLQKDFEMIETYVPTSQDALPVALCAMGAEDDNRYREDQISAWERHTSRHFETRWLAGGHRYPMTHAAGAMAFFREELSMLVAEL